MTGRSAGPDFGTTGSSGLDGSDPASERRLERAAALAFLVAGLAGVGLLVVYVLGGQTQVEGLLLTICLGGIGLGVAVWGGRLMPSRVHVEPRGTVRSTPDQVERLTEMLDEEAGFSRRRLLIGSLGAAFGGLAVALAVPIFSLGPAPGNSLRTTTWRAGSRLATPDGTDVADLPIGGVLTVFPDGDDTDPNAATLLIRVPPEALRMSAEATALAPGGFVAYSKICTHAGCPVGLYRADQQTLICPCHQSEFAVLEGARPISGPAARPLPQLPIRQEPDGTFVALGDYPTPVGPSFWDMNL